MVTYYRDKTVQITSAVVQVKDRTYPLDELAQVWHRRAGRDARGRRTLVSRIAFALAPLAPVVAAAGLIALTLRSSTTGLGRLLLFLLAVAILLTTPPLLDLTLGRVERTYDEGTMVREIWARWRGRPVLILRTGDKARFGRIYRAIQRAFEQHPPALSDDRAERPPPESI